MISSNKYLKGNPSFFQLKIEYYYNEQIKKNCLKQKCDLLMHPQLCLKLELLS